MYQAPHHGHATQAPTGLSHHSNRMFPDRCMRTNHTRLRSLTSYSHHHSPSHTYGSIETALSPVCFLRKIDACPKRHRGDPNYGASLVHSLDVIRSTGAVVAVSNHSSKVPKVFPPLGYPCKYANIATRYYTGDLVAPTAENTPSPRLDFPGLYLGKRKSR